MPDHCLCWQIYILVLKLTQVRTPVFSECFPYRLSSLPLTSGQKFRTMVSVALNQNLISVQDVSPWVSPNPPLRVTFISSARSRTVTSLMEWGWIRPASVSLREERSVWGTDRIRRRYRNENRQLHRLLKMRTWEHMGRLIRLFWCPIEF